MESVASAVYVDPLLPTTPKIFVPVSKPFGYQYQKEYRLYWMQGLSRATAFDNRKR